MKCRTIGCDSGLGTWPNDGMCGRCWEESNALKHGDNADGWGVWVVAAVLAVIAIIALAKWCSPAIPTDLVDPPTLEGLE